MKTWKILSTAALMAGAVFLNTAVVNADAVTLPSGAKAGGEGAEFDADAGKWFDGEGNPTYHVKEDGTMDFSTYRGFQRYHSECHVCHGPEGVGSTYAPALIDSVKTMSYSDFVGVVASGRVVAMPGGGDSVMPALGDNKNVMCYLDGMYTYLKGRSDGVIARGRPPGKDPKPEALGAAENACLDG